MKRSIYLRGSVNGLATLEISNRIAGYNRGLIPAPFQAAYPSLRAPYETNLCARRFLEIQFIATGNIIQIIWDHHRSSRKSLDGWTRMNQRGLFKAYQGPDPAESVRRVTHKSNISMAREDRRRAYKYVPTLEPTEYSTSLLPCRTPSSPLTA